jgi:hypothetical protein
MTVPTLVKVSTPLLREADPVPPVIAKVTGVRPEEAVALRVNVEP